MKMIMTERLILRTFVEEDAEDVYAYAVNPKIGPPAGWPPHTDVEMSRSIVRRFIQADDVWALEDRETGRVIGSIGINQDRKRNLNTAYVIGYVLSELYWGRGLMKEAVRAVFRHAFEEMGAEILTAYHYPYNTQSRRVMEKCGMVYEGTLRMATRLYTGEIMDEACHSITKKEWEQLA